MGTIRTSSQLPAERPTTEVKWQDLLREGRGMVEMKVEL